MKRSRVKSKLRTQQTLERVNQLKTENELLEEKIKMLTKELGFLKDLFLAHAGTGNAGGRTTILTLIVSTASKLGLAAIIRILVKDLDFSQVRVATV